jgi:hypothetical protein
MKRSILAAILGMAGAVSGFAQGHILAGNYYVSPYSQIVFSTGQAVGSAAGIQFQMFYGLGIVGSYAGLTPGPTFGIAAATDAFDPYPANGAGVDHGPGGYYENLDVQIPTWSSGLVTLGYIVIAGGTGQSALWQEIPVASAFPPQTITQDVGLTVTVPEPTTMALAGLGAGRAPHGLQRPTLMKLDSKPLRLRHSWRDK